MPGLRMALTTAARQANAFRTVDHRPWRLPSTSWRMAQTWQDLLFAHWPVPEASLRPHLPPGLELDTHDGSAWLGLTPFRVSALRLRGALPVPRLSSFLELNARTYVSNDGRPGIWFLSLDASSALAVEAARRLYRVPCFRARIEARPDSDGVAFESVRAGERGRAFSVRYAPAGRPASPRAGTVEHFLTERYCLYAEGNGGLYRGDIHHRPWSLQPAEAEIGLNAMAPAGVELGRTEPLLHFSRSLDVLIWPLERLAVRRRRRRSAVGRRTSP